MFRNSIEERLPVAARILHEASPWAKEITVKMLDMLTSHLFLLQVFKYLYM